MRRAILVATTVALGLPGLARAQTVTTNPFTPGLPITPAPTPTVTTPTTVTPITTTGGGSLSGGSVAVIAVGALVVLGGISIFIWRDARRRAPVRHRMAAAGRDDVRAGSKRTKARKLSPAERRRRKRGRAR